MSEDASTSESHSAASRRDWQEVFALLDTALDLDPLSHPGWLGSLDADAARHAPRLQDLLQAHAKVATGDFLQSPPAFAFAFGEAPSPFEPAAGALIGPYRLLRELGLGGMASVWLAERADGLIERRVALKLPHLSFGVASFAERMRRERRILASLTHPNIARLYDVGVADDGRPFLALEYVDGEPIDAYARTHGLSVRARVDLIVQVARAVAHAHARHVVHRDLKPSNILVDAEGQARLLDFGIAKLIDPPPGEAAEGTQATQAAGRALTADYASPEQIRGDAIGTASDIYSLGVVLFELLTGTRPYRLPRGVGAAALAEAAAAVEVPRPSATVTDPALRRALAGDLDAIVARTLAKPAAERYPSMAAFADELDRHLRGEPVQTRPRSRWQHAARWARRHRLESGLVLALPIALLGGAHAQALVLLALAAGSALALWQRNRARQQSERAQAALERAEQVKDFIASIFTHAVPRAGHGGAVSAADLLRAAARRVETDLTGQPEVAAELGLLIGASFNELGELRAGLDWLPTVVERCTQTLGTTHRLSLQSRWRLVEAANSLGELAVSEAVLPALVADLRTVQSREPALLVEALRSLAFLHAKRGLEAESMTALREAVEVATGEFGEASEDALVSRASLSNTFVHFGRFAEALAAIEPALAPARAAFGALRPHPVLLVVERNHADALARNERPRDAAGVLRRVLADQRALDADETNRVRTAVTLLANALLLGGHLDEAATLLNDAQSLHERLTGGVNDEGVGLAVRCSLVCALRGDGEGALRQIARADELAASCREAEVLVRNRMAIRALARATAGHAAAALDADIEAMADWPIEPATAQARVRLLRAGAMARRREGAFGAAEALAAQALAAAAGGGCAAIEHGLAWAEAARCSLAAGGVMEAARRFEGALATWEAGQVDGTTLRVSVASELAALRAGNNSFAPDVLFRARITS